MLSDDSIPGGFRILSEAPVLRLRCRSQANGCMIVFLLPFVAIFLSYIYALSWTLYKILNFGSWQAFQMLSGTVANYWWFPLCFLLFGAVTWFFLWHTFGVTYFQASQESLIVIKQLFMMHLKKTIPRTEMRYFSLIKDGGEGMDSFPSWGLEVVTNKRRYKRNISLPSWLPKLSDRRLDRQIYKTVLLLDRQNSTEQCNWLGRVLANFYEIDYHDTVTII